MHDSRQGALQQHFMAVHGKAIKLPSSVAPQLGQSACVAQGSTSGRLELGPGSGGRAWKAPALRASSIVMMGGPSSRLYSTYYHQPGFTGQTAHIPCFFQQYAFSRELKSHLHKARRPVGERPALGHDEPDRLAHPLHLRSA